MKIHHNDLLKSTFSTVTPFVVAAFGYGVGFVVACLFQFGGNLCGLVGIVLIGPIGAVIGFITGIVYVVVRDKRIKEKPI